MDQSGKQMVAGGFGESDGAGPNPKTLPDYSVKSPSPLVALFCLRAVASNLHRGALFTKDPPACRVEKTAGPASAKREL